MPLHHWLALCPPPWGETLLQLPPLLSPGRGSSVLLLQGRWGGCSVRWRRLSDQEQRERERERGKEGVGERHLPRPSTGCSGPPEATLEFSPTFPQILWKFLFCVPARGTCLFETMASGGYRPPGNTTDFLEEWKAKREKMRARFAAATGANNSVNSAVNNADAGTNRNGSAPPVAELNNNGGGGDRAAVPPGTASTGGRAAATAARRSDEEGRSGEGAARNPVADGVETEPPPPSAPPAAAAAASSPPVCPKNKEKKSSGPSARKGKGQIEKRKLREKRRSTGVVNIPSTESPDEDNDPSEQKLHQREDATTQQNTILNESITSDTGSPYPETSRTTSRWKGSMGAPEEDIPTYSTNSRYSGRGERMGYGRYGNSASYGGSLEKKLEEFEKELAKERQENQKLLKQLQDRDDLIGKLKEEIDLLNRDLDEIEDENDQLKQENKTLLKVVGQLTR